MVVQTVCKLKYRLDRLYALVFFFAVGWAGMTMADEPVPLSEPDVCARAGKLLMESQPSDEIRTSIASYAIFSKGDRIGEIQSRRRVNTVGNELEIASRTSMEIDGLFLDYSFKSSESVCIIDGQVKYYDAQVEENGVRSRIQAEISRNGRLVIKGSGSTESDAFESVLDEDYSVVSELAYVSVIKKRIPSITKVVLDMDDLDTRKVTYRYRGTKEMAIGESTYTTHAVEFVSPEKRGTRWFVSDCGSYLPVLERGEDENGEYGVELVKLECDSAQGAASKGTSEERQR
ncbi:MAG: hypothetical protein CSB44_02985 [Gammaproteobacteria bacterium]|nr:MAG: hypothetical protein CSB44_02985 [Gammaproteobacteria bacterium]